MSFEDNTPTHTGNFAADRAIAQRQAGERAAHSLCLAFLRIHLSVDASGHLVIGDIVSV